jgi:hypothetical protein
MFQLFSHPALCYTIVAALGLAGIGIRQWRLRMRDRDDYRLRRHIFDQTRHYGVLDDLPALRRAERPIIITKFETKPDEASPSSTTESAPTQA